MEDFVNFEIAKKLKEKEFDWKSLYVYNKEQIINPKVIEEYGELSDDGYYELTKEGGGKLDWSFVYINEYQLCQYRDVVFINDILRAPTISQVLKWLREEKEVDLVIEQIFCYDENKHREYGVRVFAPSLNKPVQCGYFNKWEKAALAGIEYVLDKLI